MAIIIIINPVKVASNFASMRRIWFLRFKRNQKVPNADGATESPTY